MVTIEQTDSGRFRTGTEHPVPGVDPFPSVTICRCVGFISYFFFQGHPSRFG